MSSASSKSSHSASEENDHKSVSEMPLSLLYGSEFLWWPYRSFVRVLLPQCHNASALLQISRKFADEIREIVRKEQDLAFNQAEKFLRQTTDISNSKNGRSTFPPETVEQFYESTIEGVREFAKAIGDAQIRSIEALRDHSREAAKSMAVRNGNSRVAA